MLARICDESRRVSLSAVLCKRQIVPANCRGDGQDSGMSTIETNLPSVHVRQTVRRVAYFDATLPGDLANTFWRNPDSLSVRGAPLRAVGTRRTVKFAHGSQEFVLKHYLEPTWRHSLKQLVQPSRAWRTWRIAHHLADAGIETPRPVGCLEFRWGPLRPRLVLDVSVCARSPVEIFFHASRQD